MSNLKDYIDAVKENYFEASVKFENFKDFAEFVLKGNEDGPKLIQLELSGIKDNQKEFKKFEGRNMVEIIVEYNKYFDKPLTQNMVNYLLDHMITGMIKAVKEQAPKVTNIKVGDELMPSKSKN